MNRIRIAATMTAVLSLGTMVPAGAQGSASLRGQVYYCDTHQPLAAAAVSVISTDGTTSVHLRTDANGRFVRVGLPAGTYRVETSPQAGRWVYSARRLARLESDDVLDVGLGVTPLTDVRSGMTLVTPKRCEPYLVPLAVPTTDRYIVH
ncbi:MAG TPA: carboxypeptidase-like regulatory domain-containing protein [Candidatus Elarobacter sp.]|jgi:hypothetical protein|nr:carboxypeptidase-like regulatory domain-containing protein [Candidatus Elarobacter sp.]